MLRRIPVETSKLNLFVGSEARPVAEYTGNGETRQRIEGGQARNEAGVPLWTLDLGTFTEDGLTVLRVKFPSPAKPELPMQHPVRVEGLVVQVVQGNQYFSAAAVSAVKQG